MNGRILVAEDHNKISGLVKLYLEKEGYEVTIEEDGLKAYERAQMEDFDLAIIDIMMPKMDGYELIKRLREMINIPIIVLSAKSQGEDKVKGLDIGADDYVTKPFDPYELVSRVKAQLRRYYNLNSGNSGNNAPNDIIKYEEIEIDQTTCTVKVNDDNIALTGTEYKLLNLLVKNPGRVFTKRQLYEEILGNYFHGDDNTIMVHICNLRDKIEKYPKEPKYIKTIRGLGYKIEKN